MDIPGEINIEGFFEYDECLKSADGKTVIAIDRNSKLLGILDGGERYYYDGLHIRNSQVVLDQKSSYEKRSLNIWGRYYFTKMVFGEEKALISATTGRANQVIRVKSVKLKISVNNLLKPYHSITIFSSHIFQEIRTKKVRKALEFAEHWDQTVGVLIAMGG